jgi:hypothetical protein
MSRLLAPRVSGVQAAERGAASSSVSSLTSARNRANAILGPNHTRTTAQDCTAEAEGNHYLSDELSDMDSLTFWQVRALFLKDDSLAYLLEQVNHSQFPRVYHLAMDVIPIQAPAVPRERIFSSGKLTITPQRNRISPELMDGLQILKFSIRHGRSLDFTEGWHADEERQVLENYGINIGTYPKMSIHLHSCLKVYDFLCHVHAIRYTWHRWEKPQYVLLRWGS